MEDNAYGMLRFEGDQLPCLRSLTRRTKEALTRAGVPTPAWAVVEDRALRDLGVGSSLAAVLDRVGLPCVVKPSRAGSAMGVGFVERSPDLPAAVMAALSLSGAAVVGIQDRGV